jgi:hypothetical protein
MSNFQIGLGIVLIISAVVIIALAIYNMVIIGKATTTLNDPNATLGDGEQKGGIAINVILILVAIVLGVYGFIVLLPGEKKPPKTPSTLRTTRSLSGSVVSPASV